MTAAAKTKVNPDGTFTGPDGELYRSVRLGKFTYVYIRECLRVWSAYSGTDRTSILKSRPKFVSFPCSVEALAKARLSRGSKK